MEPLVLLLIGFLILIVALPFVAIARANATKRSVDDLLARLSSVEDDLRTLRQSPSAAKPKAPCRRRQFQQSPARQKHHPYSRSQLDHRSIGSNSWAQNSSRGAAVWRFSLAWAFS